MKNLNPNLILLLCVLLCQACKKDDLKTAQLPGNIETIAGSGHFGFSGDGGAATSANFGWLTGVSVAGAGDIYLSDGSSNVIRKVTASTGNISTIAGIFLGTNVVDLTPYAGDGGPATGAHLNIPLSVAVASSGNVYIADAGNNVVRKITASTGNITTFAGMGPSHQGYDGDGGPAIAATLYNPYSVAVDATENVYIADSQNKVIRKVTASTGIITTIAGNGVEGYSGDGGPATSAQLFLPQGVAVDGSGNVYIADNGSHVVRMVTTSSGNITTLAGNGTAGFGGDGGPATSATFSSPQGLAVDVSGNVYVADAANNVVRKINASTGNISTVAGNGAQGYSGDGGPAIAAKLFAPVGVALDGSGNLYIADDNSVIRKVTKP